MWMINFIPDWGIHLLLFIGIGGIIVSSVLRSIIGYPIAGLIFCAALFMEGLIFGQKDMREQIAVLEAKAQEYEQETKVLNNKLTHSYQSKVKKVKEKTNEIVTYVDRYVTEHDNDCAVPNAFVVLHDNAAQATVPDSSASAYEGTSEVRISDIGKTVTKNYGIHHETVEQVKAWQEWYTEQKKLFDKIYNNEKD